MDIPFLENTLRAPGEIVYLEYDPATLPQPPSSEWTRFVCISDTHSRVFDVPPGDVLLHSGDLTNTGTVQDFEKTMSWLCSLPHKTKIIIAGNHDLPLHTGWYDENHTQWHRNAGKQNVSKIIALLKGPRALKAGVIYLQDEEHKFQAKQGGRTWSVYGSPVGHWSPYFFNWAFNYDREDGDDLIAKFPQTDILLTHGPPFGVFDRTNRDEHVGCESLASKLPELRPRLHVFGHIHEGHGAHIHTWDPNSEMSMPLVQSDDDEDQDSPVEELTDNSKKDEAGPTHANEPLLPTTPQDPTTIFVNASNWPSGKWTWRNGVRVPFGGPGVQAVVVDLKD